MLVWCLGFVVGQGFWLWDLTPDATPMRVFRLVPYCHLHHAFSHSAVLQDCTWCLLSSGCVVCRSVVVNTHRVQLVR